MALSLLYRRSLRSLSIVFALMSLTAGIGYAQLNSGNVVGKVVDSDGGPVPGVTVTISGIGAPQTFVTETDGDYRFLRLSPGRYSLIAELAGFSTLTRPVDVNVGTNSDVTIEITPALDEAITITAETPLLDIRSNGTGANITEVELEGIPSGRDPWVLLQTVPGVLVDRVNIGGNQSGQQSYFIGKGVERHQTEWNLDGVNVTEMQATGTSGFYYDFDSFEEFRVSTGSTDPSVSTPGVQISMVTRRGSNELNGSARWFKTDQDYQATPTVPAEAVDYLDAANSIDYIDDYGLEAGGPLWKDRLWLWGAYSKNNINNFAAGEGTLKETELENWNGKLNAQVWTNNSASLYYMFSDKVVLGRGVSSSRPPETGTNQSGPGSVLKFEDTHTFSPSFYATVVFADIDNGYKLDPVGGRDVQVYWDNDGGRAHRTYKYFEQSVPQKNYRVDGANFLELGGIDHELKYGFSYRDAPVESLTAWPGGGVWGEFWETEDEPDRAAITRDAVPIYGSEYYDLYLGDTVLFRNFSFTGGLRYDLQRASNDPVSVPGNPIFPDVFAPVDFAGDSQDLEFDQISPKLGVTYALGSNKRTLIRGGYARYMDQLGSSDVGPNNPFYTSQKLYYEWEDRNGDQTVQRDEVLLDRFLYADDVDPDNPNAGFSTGRVDYGMNPTTTDELILGLEHELVPGFALGINYSYRLRDNFIWNVFEKTRGSGDLYTPPDFELRNSITGTLPDGTPYSVPNYRLRSGIPRPVFSVTTNRPDYTQTYQGVELTATKRMSAGWMLRANVTLSKWEQQVGNNAISDPTRLLVNALDGCNICDGAPVASAGGSDGYINSRWAYSLTALYQLPWKVMLGAAVVGREGYVLPYYFRVNNRDGFGNKQILLQDFGDNRLDDLFNLDFRIARDFELPLGVAFSLSADLFNATNQRTVLWRDHRLYAADGADPDNNWIEELQSPRVWRLGARVKF